jgi:hypothetical protein
MFEFGPQVIRTLEPLFQLFRDESVAPSLALWIGVAALACAVWLGLVFVAPTWLEIRRRTRALRDLPDREAFARGFERFDGLMRVRGRLRHAWGELKEALILPEEDEPRPVVRNTVRPSLYLNLHDLGLHFRGFHALPNVFVGVGLLFTFAGLVAALRFASEGIGAGDLDRTQQALTDLLRAATFKFYTSIAGLLASILFGFFLRSCVSWLEHALDRLCTELEARMLFVTPEALALRHLRLAETQAVELKRFNTELAIAIGRQVEAAFDAALARRVEPAAQAMHERLAQLPHELGGAMTPAVAQLEQAVAQIADQNRTRLGDLAEDFHKQLRGAAGAELQGLAQTLARVGEALDRTSGQLGASGEDLLRQVQSATLELTAAVKEIEGTMRGLQDRARAEAEADGARRAQQFEAMRQDVERVVGSLAEAQEATLARLNRESDDAAARIGERLQTAAEQLERSGAVVMATVAQVSGHLAELGMRVGAEVEAQVKRAAAETAERQAGAMEAGQRRMAEATAAIVASLDGLGERFAAASASLAAQVDQALEGLRAVERRFAEHAGAITRASEGAGKSATAFEAAAIGIGRATAPVLQAVQVVAQSVDGLKSANADSVAAVRGTLQRIEAVGATIAETSAALREVWDQHAGRFAQVDVELGKAFRQMVEGAQANAEAIRRYVEEFDGALADSVERLGGAVEELSEFASELGTGTALLGKTGERLASAGERLAMAMR